VNFQQSKKDSSLPLGKASSAGGAVDHFTNILLQEENRKLKQEKSKYEKKTEKLQHELQRLQKEKKENEHLEEKVAQLRDEEKRLGKQIDDHNSARAPLENVNSLLENFKTSKLKQPEPPKPKKRTNEIEEGCNQQ
ncbi:Hypothetical predicted protein, partial [Mytilus galloprovincialis]